MPPTPASKRRRTASPMRGSSDKKTATPCRPPANSPTDSQGNRDWKRRKQQQSHDYNTHQFLDSSATVHPGLFGARRLPEIKSLWRRMVQGELNALNDRNDGRNDGRGKRTDKSAIRRVGESGGGKISSRHLRRRTNSHKRRRRHRFPRGKDESGVGDTGKREDAECDDDVMGDKKKSDTVASSEHSAEWSNRGPNKRKPCRRARRKPALMKISHSNWWQPRTKIAQMNGKSECIEANESKSPHNWIPTHLWHAKRFHVSPPLFSWPIPLLHSNRGSRASLRLASSEPCPKCTIQDGTWEVNGCAIKLEVTEVDASHRSERRPVQTLVSILRRLCGFDSPLFEDESIIAGKRSGEGLLHEIDAHPLRPIGPAAFVFGSASNGEASKNAHVFVLVHPAIHQKVVCLLATILSSEFDESLEVALSTTPLALLRIRGRASMSTLLNVLEQSDDIGLLDGSFNHGDLVELGTPSSLTMAPSNEIESIPNAITNPSSILLKSHQPNQSHRHLPHNLACSGWDIICHASVSSSLFQSFVNDGCACAIGLAEDARAHLEAFPPLPIFPRDYPDTEEGKAYWEGSAIEASVVEEGGANSTWNDWTVIRTCFEGSWGRINTPLKRTIRHWKKCDSLAGKKEKKDGKNTSEDSSPSKELITKDQISGRDVTSIHWGSLVAADAELPIVVRGSFGIPFLQLLHGCGKLFDSPSSTSDSSEKSRRRRPRRTVRPPSSNVQASPLSKKDLEAHSNLCRQLRASLSLPALLRCELSCDGKGTLNSGDLILPLASQCDRGEISEDSDGEDGESRGGSDDVKKKSRASPLGVVIAGGFSPCRGKCHGVGFLGAAKLIDALDGTDRGMGMPMPQSNGRKMMMLEVVVVRDAPGARGRRALLSILL